MTTKPFYGSVPSNTKEINNLCFSLACIDSSLGLQMRPPWNALRATYLKIYICNNLNLK